MANFGDPLWGDPLWDGSSAAPFVFPPSDEERGRIDIDQIRASVKSGGKSVVDSQLVTTVGTRIAGGGGVWDANLNWVYSASATVPGNGLITVFVNGSEVATDGAPLINSGSLATFLVNGA